MINAEPVNMLYSDGEPMIIDISARIMSDIPDDIEQELVKLGVLEDAEFLLKVVVGGIVNTFAYWILNPTVLQQTSEGLKNAGKLTMIISEGNDDSTLDS